MKGKIRRKIRRFFGIPLAIVGVAFTVGGLIAASLQHLVSPIVESLQPFPVWVWLTIFWLIVLVILVLKSWGLLYIYSKSLTPEIKYFETVNFEKPDKNTILMAIDGILNTEKVQPFYVHVAPRSKEVETVYLRLEETGFAMVSGRPGEGKSMLAYHAAYGFQEKDQYRVYTLVVERLQNKTGKEITNELLSQLDNLKGKRKLIIVDDAHKLELPIKQDLNTILQEEAKEGHGKYIWIETELYGEEQIEPLSYIYIRVNFQEFYEDLLKHFYQSQKPFLQKALEGRIEGLNDAIDRVNKRKILDVWWFAFCASKGEERLAQKVADLKDHQLLVLFFISAYTVLSGESELYTNYVRSKITALEFGWLTDYLRTLSVGNIVNFLQSLKLIKIYDKSKMDRDYIASLHYNFARVTIQVALNRHHLAEDLLASMKTLLTDDYRRCVYLGVFHHDIGVYAAGFVHENKNWLINFINNPLSEWLKCYPPLLKSIKTVAKDTYNEIIENMDIHRIAERVSSAEVEQFQQLAYLLNAIGDRRDELIGKLDLEQLSTKANGAEVEQFEQLANLLNAIGDRRDELLRWP